MNLIHPVVVPLTKSPCKSHHSLSRLTVHHNPLVFTATTNNNNNCGSLGLRNPNRILEHSEKADDKEMFVAPSNEDSFPKR